VDVLSDTLNVVRLSGAVFFTAEFASPWAVASPPAEALMHYLRLPSNCIALFHIVAEGTCHVSVEGTVLDTLCAGEIVIFPHGSPHIMSSDARLKPTPISDLLPPFPFQGIPMIELGSFQKTDRFICGYLYCDQRFNPLIGALPEILFVHSREHRDQTDKVETGRQLHSGAITIHTDEWLDATLKYMMKEAHEKKQGSDVMLVRLTEILYVEILRRYMQTLPSSERGWLAGVNDPIIGQTLRLLHAHPERAWTVEELAFSVACSRSSLAQRFTMLIGESPIQYLAAWRMQLAQYLLKQPDMNIGKVAERVGYESEAAFNRAFKRHFGEPPAAWRTKHI
jgi:AraC family transcriptional regulator, alkane utilization regulator